MLRSLFKLAFLAVVVYLCATLSLGDRTLFGHVQNIWASDETQELVDGVKDRVKQGLRDEAEQVARDELPETRIQATQ